MAVGSLILVLCSLSPALVEGIVRRVPRVHGWPLVRKVLEYYRAYSEFRNRPVVLLVFVGLTFLELLFLILVNFLIARSLGVDVSFVYFLAVMPLLHILVRLPISYQAIGVQEGLFVFFLTAVGFSASDGLSVSLLHRAVEILVGVVPSVILLARPSTRRGEQPPAKDTT